MEVSEDEIKTVLSFVSSGLLSPLVTARPIEPCVVAENLVLLSFQILAECD